MSINLRQILAEQLSNYGYRAGDLNPNNKPEQLHQFRGQRGTGHFGTGFYFFGDLEQARDYAQQTGGQNSSRVVNQVDFSKYNLLKVRTQAEGLALHKAFSNVNGRTIRYINGNKKEFITSQIKAQIIPILNDFNQKLEDYYMDDYISEFLNLTSTIQTIESIEPEYFTYNEVIDVIENAYIFQDRYENDMAQVNKLFQYYFPLIKEKFSMKFDLQPYINLISEQLVTPIAKAICTISGRDFNEVFQNVLKTCYNNLRLDAYNNAKNEGEILSSKIMKGLGYEGIDVRGVQGLDNSSYGSVIFDIKN